MNTIEELKKQLAYADSQYVAMDAKNVKLENKIDNLEEEVRKKFVTLEIKEARIKKLSNKIKLLKLRNNKQSILILGMLNERKDNDIRIDVLLDSIQQLENALESEKNIRRNLEQRQ